MPEDPSADLLNRLEAGFQSHAQELEKLTDHLEAAAQKVRTFREARHPSQESQAHWQSLEESLRRIEALAQKIVRAIEGSDRAEMRRALEAREALRAEDEKLVSGLRLIRDQAAGGAATDRAEWNSLAEAVVSQLDAVHACVLLIQTKLELTEGRTPEQVRDFVRDVLQQLSHQACPDGMSRHAYELEYLRASIEVDHEKHEALGFPRNIKTLFTWFESPEERVRRNLALPVD